MTGRITISCPGCGKNYVVPETFAGRKGNCKACGASFIVQIQAAGAGAPAAADRPSPVVPQPRETPQAEVRSRRRPSAKVFAAIVALGIALPASVWVFLPNGDSTGGGTKAESNSRPVPQESGPANAKESPAAQTPEKISPAATAREIVAMPAEINAASKDGTAGRVKQPSYGEKDFLESRALNPFPDMKEPPALVMRLDTYKKDGLTWLKKIQGAFRDTSLPLDPQKVFLLIDGKPEWDFAVTNNRLEWQPDVALAVKRDLIVEILATNLEGRTADGVWHPWFRSMHDPYKPMKVEDCFQNQVLKSETNPRDKTRISVATVFGHPRADVLQVIWADVPKSEFPAMFRISVRPEDILESRPLPPPPPDAPKIVMKAELRKRDNRFAFPESILRAELQDNKNQSTEMDPRRIFLTLNGNAQDGVVFKAKELEWKAPQSAGDGTMTIEVLVANREVKTKDGLWHPWFTSRFQPGMESYPGVKTAIHSSGSRSLYMTRNVQDGDNPKIIYKGVSFQAGQDTGVIAVFRPYSPPKPVAQRAKKPNGKVLETKELNPFPGLSEPPGIELVVPRDFHGVISGAVIPTFQARLVTLNEKFDPENTFLLLNGEEQGGMKFDGPGLSWTPEEELSTGMRYLEVIVGTQQVRLDDGKWYPSYPGRFSANRPIPTSASPSKTYEGNEIYKGGPTASVTGWFIISDLPKEKYSDFQNPVISVDKYPKIVSGNSFVLSFTMEDNDPLKDLHMRLPGTGGKDLEVNADLKGLKKISYTTTVCLPCEGEHLITITVADRFHNYSHETVRVTRKNSPPELILNAPLDVGRDYRTGGDRVLVRGRLMNIFEDDWALKEEKSKALVLVGGKAAKLFGNGDFEHGVDLKNGKNEILIVATDPAGNRAQEKILVTRDDNLPPELEHMELKSVLGSRLGGEKLRLSGRNFRSSMRVMFGQKTAQKIEIIDDCKAFAVTPPSPDFRTVPVFIQGTKPDKSAFSFVYRPAFTCEQLQSQETNNLNPGPLTLRGNVMGWEAKHAGVLVHEVGGIQEGMNNISTSLRSSTDGGKLMIEAPGQSAGAGAADLEWNAASELKVKGPADRFFPLSVQGNTYQGDIELEEGCHVVLIVLRNPAKNLAVGRHFVIWSYAPKKVDGLITLVTKNPLITQHTKTLAIMGKVLDRNVKSVVVNGKDAELTGEIWRARVEGIEKTDDIKIEARASFGRTQEILMRIR